MTKGELMNMLERIARETHLDMNESIRRNNHMNVVKENEPDVPQHIIDAILCQYINDVATQQGMDLGLYTHYLYKKE